MSLETIAQPARGPDRPLRRIAVALFAGAIAITATIPAAEAGGRRLGITRDYGYNGLSEGYVVARSRHGNGSVSGPVRETSLGPQVRLPGGTWEYCRRSCSETLRVETVDFWAGRDSGSSGLAQECGIFGCLGIHFGY